MEITHRNTYNTKREYLVAHLELLNCLLPVKTTPKERLVLALFMEKPGEKFSPKNGVAVREELQIKSANLSAIIRDLTKKELLREKEDGLLEIHPIVIPEEDKQDYNISYAFLQEEV